MAIRADYAMALAAQIGGMSAFMGGFAATFLAMLLTLGHRSRACTIAIIASTVAAVALVLALVAATALTAALHPHAPSFDPGRAMLVQGVMGGSFLLGMVALLAGIGASGWTRSRAVGWTTSGLAAFGAIGCVLLLLG